MDNQEKISRKNKTSSAPNIKEKNATKKRNPLPKSTVWKVLFLVLLAFNLAVVLFVGVRATSFRDEAILSRTQATSKNQSVATVTSTTQELNQLIATYINANQSKNSDLTYKFYISQEQAVLNMTYKVLGTKIPIYIYFEPLALSDGSISLNVTSISAGTLGLPTKEILQLLKSYNLPTFVEVKSSSSQLVIHLDQIKVAGGFYLKSNQIDLTAGKFSFDLMKKN